MKDQEFWDTVFLRYLDLTKVHEGAGRQAREARIESAREIADFAAEQRRKSRKANAPTKRPVRAGKAGT